MTNDFLCVKIFLGNPDKLRNDVSNLASYRKLAQIASKRSKGSQKNMLLRKANV